MNYPVVSVCIATYNQERYIGNCITSVLSQITDVRLEIIIGDDGDDVETPRIVHKLMQQHPGIIRYIRHKINLGPSANYQFLVQEAQGEYIAHLDGDDFWLPGKIKTQLDWLTHNPGSVACYSNAVVISDDGEMRGIFGPVIREPVTLQFLIVKGNFLNHSSMLYRAKYKATITELVGPFIDYKMHLNFARIAPVGYINAALTVYRLGSEHSMIRNTPALVQQLYFEAMNFVLSDCSISAQARRKALTHFWQSIALESIVKGRLKWSISWSKQIRLLYPRDSWNVLPLGILAAFWRLLLLVLSRTLSSWIGTTNLRVLHNR